jgi:hypothetical protein
MPQLKSERLLQELDAHGPFASILLGITVLSDLFVMLSFTVTCKNHHESMTTFL